MLLHSEFFYHDIKQRYTIGNFNYWGILEEIIENFIKGRLEIDTELCNKECSSSVSLSLIFEHLQGETLIQRALKQALNWLLCQNQLSQF